MAVIDKKLYEKLNNWCQGERPKNQSLLYVNIRDRQLTNATVRKLMYEIDKEDIYGEEYIEFFSADYFYKHMREYYSYVADLYMKHPQETDSLETIIDSIPGFSGWITLIVEDLEVFTGDPDKMEKMVETLMNFACTGANVILISKGDYPDVFSSCEYVLSGMNTGIAAKEEDCLLMIGCIAQDETPGMEKVSYASSSDERDELNFYWTRVNEQLQNNNYFEYNDFKVIFNDTLRYLIPRVSKERINRKDIPLVRNIGNFRIPDWKGTDGCKIWELRAAKKFAKGLYRAVANTDGDNDEFSEGTIRIWVKIEDREIENNSVYISGYTGFMDEIRADNALSKMDKLAEAIRRCEQEGNMSAARKLAGIGTDTDAEDPYNV